MRAGPGIGAAPFGQRAMRRPHVGDERLGQCPLLAGRQSAGNAPPQDPPFGAASRVVVQQRGHKPASLRHAPVVDRQAITGP